MIKNFWLILPEDFYVLPVDWEGDYPGADTGILRGGG